MATSLSSNLPFLSLLMSLLLILIGDNVIFLSLFICQADIIATPAIPLLSSVSMFGIAGMACSNMVSLAVIGCTFSLIFICLVLGIHVYGLIFIVLLSMLLLFVRGCIGEMSVCYSIWCTSIVSVCICCTCILLHCGHIILCLLISLCLL